LNEMAASAGCSIEIVESALPLRTEVRGMCEILGFDPLYLANEGTLILFAPPDQADAALAAMQSQEAGRNAKIIGRASSGPSGRVVMQTIFGGMRIVDTLVGEQLPRIC
jgi:hydrogenase expression/formation protein HypE